ncbi:MAG: serine/threonine-protein kinase [Phycisphaerales bacterium JB037]
MATDPRRVRQVFDAVIELDPADRRSAVHTACAGDDDLASEVLSLLEHIEEGDGEPDEPARARPGSKSRSGGMFAIRELLAGEVEDARRFAKGDRVADCEILGYIGGGGMAEVYKARQAVSHRTVAIKVMTEQIDSPAARQRFEVEARTLGHLRHPHIAQVLGVVKHPLGDGGSLPVIVMEYVEGGKTITEFADLRSLTTRDRVELFALVCDAMIHAHQRGVIHRDLKPGNVLVDRDRAPKVIDFGISRLTQAEMPEGQTPDPQMLGTPAYASPEHLSGEPSRIDTRSDVLCLGLILYELVARRRAFDFPMGGTDELQSVIEGALPEPPSALRPSDPACNADLDAIIGFCVAKDPSHRYQSVLDLKRDLQAWLDGRPLLFSRGDPNGVRLAGVRRGAVAGGLALTLVALAGIGAWGWSERTGRIQADRATAGAREEAAEARAWADDARAEAAEANRQRAQAESDTDSQRRRAVAEAAGSQALRRMIESLIKVMAGPTSEPGIDADAADRFLSVWKQSLVQLEAKIAEEAGQLSPSARARQWEFLGLAYELAGFGDEAIRAYDESLDALQGGEGTDSDIARVRLLLGDRLFQSGQYAQAMNRFRDAHDYYESHGDQPLASLECLLGMIRCMRTSESPDTDTVRTLIEQADDLIVVRRTPDASRSELDQLAVLCTDLARLASWFGVETRCGEWEVPGDADFAAPG